MSTFPSLLFASAADLLKRPFLAESAPTWAQIAYCAMRAVETPAHANLMRAFLPYVLHHTARKEVFCVVHRGYHALGCTTWTNYERADEWHVSAGWYAACVEARTVNRYGALFDDWSAPWVSVANLRDYRRKVERLLCPWMVTP
jgi:hypothetical protein